MANELLGAKIEAKVLAEQSGVPVAPWSGGPVALAGMPQVKFLQPLLPEQAARIELQRDGNRVRFRVLRDAQPIASGDLELQP